MREKDIEISLSLVYLTDSTRRHLEGAGVIYGIQLMTTLGVGGELDSIVAASCPCSCFEACVLFDLELKTFNSVDVVSGLCSVGVLYKFGFQATRAKL